MRCKLAREGVVDSGVRLAPKGWIRMDELTTPIHRVDVDLRKGIWEGGNRFLGWVGGGLGLGGKGGRRSQGVDGIVVDVEDRVQSEHAEQHGGMLEVPGESVGLVVSRLALAGRS